MRDGQTNGVGKAWFKTSSQSKIAQWCLVGGEASRASSFVESWPWMKWTADVIFLRAFVVGMRSIGWYKSKVDQANKLKERERCSSCVKFCVEAVHALGRGRLLLQ